jgi:ABC-type transport system substrate-binding protein
LTPGTYDTPKAKSLLAEAGYPEGFEVKIITSEGWKLEAQNIKRMLERIGLKVRVDVFTYSEWLQKMYMPILDKPPEEQDWDVSLAHMANWFGHIGATFLTFNYLEESDWRWIEHDPAYERMWKDMARTVDTTAQEEKIWEIAEYLHVRAYTLNIYSPLTLYAVNKEAHFVPQRFQYLRLKETSVSENHWSVRGKNN